MTRGLRGGAPRRGVVRVDPTRCTGHGLCAMLLPELVSLDEWGYPLIADRPVPPGLQRQAGKAVASCPALALRLTTQL